RKAWPDDFANVYASEEIDRSRMADMLPSDAASAGAAEERLERIGGGHTILIDWMDNQPLCAVPVGSFADRVMEFLRANAEEPSAVNFWANRNRHALREFWARSPGDALDLKKHIEKATAQIAVTEEAGE
ncbi:MAG: phage recombination protein Bet, partial [Microvirga sp.]|nr:phage recombination protein Bet [Microvirga sp.]